MLKNIYLELQAALALWHQGRSSISGESPGFKSSCSHFLLFETLVLQSNYRFSLSPSFFICRMGRLGPSRIVLVIYEIREPRT